MLGTGSLKHDNLKHEYKNLAKSDKVISKNVEEIDMPNGNGWQPPRSIFSAISEIQRYHVIEGRTEIPREYFTIEQVLDFFKIGFWGGLIESLLFTLLVTGLQIAYPTFKEYFFNSHSGFVENIILLVIAYSPVFIIGILMMWLSKYYQGDFTKRAIFSLVNGRCVSFLLKAIVVYFLFYYIFLWSQTDYDLTSAIVGILFNIFVRPFYPDIELAQFLNYFYARIVPILMTVAKQVSIVMILTALVPYVTIFRKSYIEQVKKKEVEKELENY